MSKPNLALSKTCASCGQQKPLSAFLQLNAKKGTIYGNICSSCRKANMEKVETTQETEDSTTPHATHTIDSKSKVYQENQNKQQFEKKELEKEVSRQETDDIKTQKDEKTLTTATEERRQRGFLEKQSFLHHNKAAQENMTRGLSAREAELAFVPIDRREQEKTADRAQFGEQFGKNVFDVELNKFLSWLGPTPMAKRLQNQQKAKTATAAPTAENTTQEPSIRPASPSPNPNPMKKR
ncbi:MAG TPA: hypothetical protein VHZ76_10730 [Gammaproteobacteria bacterium]|jgi:hypothetical protein|nr:hypothetical protein [Gammaproteobacteria bacterium]